ncbi:hypothetical protein ADIS_3837 [Lunatimonas lonarensis]|uniref:Uncharacterized protein n=1 Tax=Lunatimonas lonarensis TaxID=1232681 RepID=R7ZNN2_9BACT|nr:hypothetical protein ADIS_3837 [Lunatimonas lonarensis]
MFSAGYGFFCFFFNGKLNTKGYLLALVFFILLGILSPLCFGVSGQN